MQRGTKAAQTANSQECGAFLSLASPRNRELPSSTLELWGFAAFGATSHTQDGQEPAALVFALQRDHVTANPSPHTYHSLLHGKQISLELGKVLFFFFCLKIVSPYNLQRNIKPLSSHTNPTGHPMSAAKSCPGRQSPRAQAGAGRQPRALIRHSRRKTEPRGLSGVAEASQLEERGRARLGPES